MKSKWGGLVSEESKKIEISWEEKLFNKILKSMGNIETGKINFDQYKIHLLGSHISVI